MAELEYMMWYNCVYSNLAITLLPFVHLLFLEAIIKVVAKLVSNFHSHSSEAILKVTDNLSSIRSVKKLVYLVWLANLLSSLTT